MPQPCIHGRPPARILYGALMSIEVPTDDLLAQVEEWGWCYLATVSDDGRAHLLALRPLVVDGALRLDVGTGRARRNVAARSDVALVFPPRVDATEHLGYSLVVDGRGEAVDDATIDVRPTSAVLHRPAP